MKLSNSFNLGNGLLGLSLFCLDLYNWTNDEYFKEQGIKQLEYVAHKFSKSTSFLPSLFEGQLGILFLLSAWKKEVNIELDHSLYQNLLERLFASTQLYFKKNYRAEYFSGASGVLFFANYISNKELAALMTDYLQRSLTNSPYGHHWQTLKDTKEIFLEEEHFEILDGVNIGIGHGLCGTLLALLNEFRVTNNSKTKDLLEKGVQTITNIFEKKSTRYFPPKFPSNTEPFHLGWCYGELGIVHTLLEIAKHLNRMDIKTLADNILTQIQPTAINPKEETHLCHGAASNIILLESIGTEHLGAFLDSQKKLLLNSKNQNPSLLYGVLGEELVKSAYPYLKKSLLRKLILLKMFE